MILLLSDPMYQGSMDLIIDWLRYYGAPFRRVNGLNPDELDLLELRTDRPPTISVNGESIDPGSVGAVWFFRWDHPTLLGELDDRTKKEGMEKEIQEQILRERQRLSGSFFRLFSHARWLSNPYKGSINKLEVLKEAEKVGLQTPPTLLTTNKECLEAFFEECKGELITKPSYEIFMTEYRGAKHASYTSELSSEDILDAPEYFLPSLFQKKIPKRAEIRSFFLDGTFYSMAIFSQADPQTRSDFRVYNDSDPNRKVPFQLPEYVEENLDSLFKRLELRTGSADLLLDEEGGLHFLEINHLGQFGMTSNPCNYPLERRIAETLIADDRR